MYIYSVYIYYIYIYFSCLLHIYIYPRLQQNIDLLAGYPSLTMG